MDVHDTKVTQREKYTKQRENERLRAGGRRSYGGMDEQAEDRTTCLKTPQHSPNTQLRAGNGLLFNARCLSFTD